MIKYKTFFIDGMSQRNNNSVICGYWESMNGEREREASVEIDNVDN